MGSETDAPQAAARFFDADKKINFYAFSQGGMNAVLHREGTLFAFWLQKCPWKNFWLSPDLKPDRAEAKVSP